MDGVKKSTIYFFCYEFKVQKNILPWLQSDANTANRVFPIDSREISESFLGNDFEKAQLVKAILELTTNISSSTEPQVIAANGAK